MHYLCACIILYETTLCNIFYIYIYIYILYVLHKFKRGRVNHLKFWGKRKDESCSRRKQKIGYRITFYHFVLTMLLILVYPGLVRLD